MERNEERVDLFLMGYRKAVDVEMMRTSNREHRAIYRAIVQRDPDAAARLSIYHLQSVRERFAALIGDDDRDDSLPLDDQTKEPIE